MPFDHTGIIGFSGGHQAPADLVVKSISVGSRPPSGAFSQLQASETESIKSPSLGTGQTNRLDACRTNRWTLRPGYSLSWHVRMYTHQRDERLQTEPISFAINQPEIQTGFKGWKGKDGNVRHEQRAPATLFSVSALSQLQLRADCLPQEPIESPDCQQCHDQEGQTVETHTWLEMRTRIPGRQTCRSRRSEPQLKAL